MGEAAGRARDTGSLSIMETTDSGRLIIFGILVAFALLIAAVWASDVSLATSLALTGGIVLVGVAAITMILPTPMPRGRVDDQRDRMKETTP